MTGTLLCRTIGDFDRCGDTVDRPLYILYRWKLAQEAGLVIPEADIRMVNPTEFHVKTYVVIPKDAYCACPSNRQLSFVSYFSRLCSANTFSGVLILREWVS